MPKSKLFMFGLFGILIAIGMSVIFLSRPKRRVEQISEPFKIKEKYAIVQYDDRDLSKEHTTFVKINKAYAARHGYDHFLITNGYEDVPPYWAKVKCVKDILNTKEGEKYVYKGVLWIDTDACVTRIDTSFDEAFQTDKDFVFSPDGPWFESSMNAGVWFVRNTPKGREIIDTWYSHYKPSDWEKEGEKKWRSKGTWAGTTYEQGAFTDLVMPKFKDDMENKPWQFLQGFYKTDQSFTVHFAGPTLKKIQELFLQDFLKTHSGLLISA